MSASIFCFALASMNVPFIVADPTGAVMNWTALVFVFGVGIALANNRKK